MNKLLPLSVASGQTVETELLLVGCFQGEIPEAHALVPGAAESLRVLAAREGFGGRERQYAETAVAGGGAGVSVVALMGLGERDELDAIKLRQWLTSAVDAAATNGFGRVAVALPAHAETRGPAAAERTCRQLMLAGYRFERYLSKSPERERRIAEVAVVPPAGEEEAYRGCLATAAATARGVLLARELGNTPANEATPEWLEDQARELAARLGMKVTSLELEQLEAKGMGGLLAVGAGSAQPPRLVRLSWGGEGPRVALVGKGVTFDTGGISLKPPASMDEMKYDKCGACTALGVASAVAELALPVRLEVYLPLAENMPDGRSYRPGDIITCYNGKTVEVTNTDAEGRMILADAMAWAVEEGAEMLLEYSTLTGGCMVALGLSAAGLYSPDDELAAGLLAAAGRSGERLWRLPLWPELKEQVKGNHADLKNSGERWGSANYAATFLASFVGSLRRWAHMDIAGPASIGKNGPGPVGATGYGVAFSVDWLRTFTS